jgi:septal ring-binding cell division protein DamX
MKGLRSMGQRCLIGFPAFLFLLAGCGPGKEAFQSPDVQDEKSKKPLSYYEATLRPSDFDEEVEIVQKAHSQTAGFVPLEIPSDSAVIVEEFTQGFRVQIFASSSIDEANAAKATAEEKAIRDSIYIVYDPPVYKVRVGDYATRFEANQHLTRLVNIGYPDAWVVADRVVQRKMVRVSRQN